VAATAVAASTFYCKLIMHTKQVLSIVSSGLAEDAPYDDDLPLGNVLIN